MNEVERLQWQAQKSRAEFLQAASALRRHITMKEIAKSLFFELKAKRHATETSGRLFYRVLSTIALIAASRQRNRTHSKEVRRQRSTRRKFK